MPSVGVHDLKTSGWSDGPVWTHPRSVDRLTACDTDKIDPGLWLQVAVRHSHVLKQEGRVLVARLSYSGRELYYRV